MDAFVNAPKCITDDGKHIIEFIYNDLPWYAKCTECGERFALISETVIKVSNLSVAQHHMGSIH